MDALAGALAIVTTHQPRDDNNRCVICSEPWPCEAHIHAADAADRVEASRRNRT